VRVWANTSAVNGFLPPLLAASPPRRRRYAKSMRLRLVRIDEPWAGRRMLLGVRDRGRLAAPAHALVDPIERRTKAP
jgi:hypothetical protein